MVISDIGYVKSVGAWLVMITVKVSVIYKLSTVSLTVKVKR